MGIAGQYQQAHVWSVAAAQAPERVTSAWMDEQLSETYERCGIRPGLLESVAGIVERRWWPEETRFDQAAALAGEAAMVKAGVTPHDVDLLISTSVCKHHLEPSVACVVHHHLGLGTHAVNFDMGNACLGFINALDVAAMAIELGRVRCALIVDGEGSREPQLRALERLAADGATAEDVFENFATLTLGSGAAAMVMGGPRDGAHRYVGGVQRAATEHHGLCVGDLNAMRTDTAGLLTAGLTLAEESWHGALAGGWDWQDMDRYILHQVSAVHTGQLCERLGIDLGKVPLTYPMFGNIGPAAVPYTLAGVADELRDGERILLMGIGSGLNTAFAELIW